MTVIPFRPTLDGKPPTLDHGHTGLPTSDADILDRQRRGLPSYCPTDGVLINQTEYRRFAAERGPNSA